MATAIRVASFLAIALLIGCRDAAIQRAFPRKPIKVIVPFSAGGGSDTFTRIVQDSVRQHGLLSQPLVVINVPGAAGTVGSRRVKQARPDGYTILQLHEGILTSKYSGNAPYGPESFEPIVGTGRTPHVIAVAQDSPYQDLTDLLDDAEKRPDEIIYAVGIGAPSHFAGLLIEKKRNGARFRFTQSGGGAKRFASLLGGHAVVTTFSVAEFVDFSSSGLRALAILTPERHAAIPHVLTALEQGVDVVSTNMHFWWAPKGTPPDRIDFLAKTIREAVDQDEVRTRLAAMLTEPAVLQGSELAADLQQREQQIAAVSIRPSTRVPPLPVYVLVAAFSVGVLALLELRKPAGRRGVSATMRAVSRNSKRSVTIICSFVAYICVMQFNIANFMAATFLFVTVSGMALSNELRKQLAIVLLLAVVLSVGLYGVFTYVLVVDLP